MSVTKKDNSLRIIKMLILEITITKLNSLSKEISNLVKSKIHLTISLNPIIILIYEIQMKIYKI
jgi:hypothetical protein